MSVAAGSTVVSSVYHDITTNQLLEEFDPASIKTLDKFLFDIGENSADHNIDNSIVKKIALPTKILKKDQNDVESKIEYKNRFGATVSITVKDGKGKLSVF